MVSILALREPGRRRYRAERHSCSIQLGDMTHFPLAFPNLPLRWSSVFAGDLGEVGARPVRSGYFAQ